MIEQKKMDAELRQIVTDALVSMVSGVTGLVPPAGPGAIPDFIQAPIDRAVERISASLPVGVPDESMVEMAAAAYERAAHVGATHEQAWHEALSVALSASATPTIKAEQVDMADAYVGAREDLAIWKRRALEAEQKVRHQEQIIDHLTLETQGETRFGEPSIPSAEPVAVIEYAGYDPANSIRWLNKGLQYMEPGTLLYAQAPSLPAAGSAVEEVEVVGYRFFHVDHGYIFRRTHIYEGNPSLEAHSLMTVAQHNRIVAALSAQQAGAVSVPKLAGLCSVNHQLGIVALGFKSSEQTQEAVRELRALLNGGGV
ncbi:hypothetical protein ACPA2N_25700 [Ectopseudomonas hydrolytica]|uniref:hypothetical protein n=1 Tax=Ectopseudomonas hydrolytica TaxID=2493633 RepID=UPI003C2FD557